MKQILKYILSVVMENLRLSETKHTISITLSSAVIVFAASQFEIYSKIGIVFGSLAISFCAVSIILSLFALNSKFLKVKTRKRHNDKVDSLLFFQNISTFGEEDYVDEIITSYSLPKSYKPDEFDLDIARQIIATSKAAVLKYKFFNLSLFFLNLALALCVVSIIVSEVLL